MNLSTVLGLLLSYCSFSAAQQPSGKPVNEKLFDQQLVAVLRHLELSPPCSSVLDEIQTSHLPKEEQLSDIKIFSRTSGAALAIMISKEYPDFQPRLKRVNEAMLQVADICNTHPEYSYTQALKKGLEKSHTIPADGH